MFMEINTFTFVTCGLAFVRDAFDAVWLLQIGGRA